ncbi:holo-ACP synthase [Sediminibacillus massiliensis]|uniref:holo-ACP synthase n=1 Tax=Sediminibacillus massiliensis TaxID=1926277 RepID=UPI0009887C90|nr:holo-ACP synthase [Sediminibacillus massiliensis]
MIKGIGIDIIELKRIQSSINKNDRFVQRVLTEKEREAYYAIKSPGRQVEYLAGRFAAKEAYSKALGTGLGKLGFQDIEIQADEKGAPQLVDKRGSGVHTFLSISHSKEYAVAQVVLEEREI